MRFGLLPALFVAAVLLFAAKRTVAKSLDSGRIAEIARLLGDGPAGFGHPVDRRQVWDRLAEQEAWQRMISRAENLAHRPITDLPDELYLEYSRTGNRSHYQRAYGRRRRRLRALAMAESLENDGRFVPPLEDAIRALCEQKSWQLPAHDRDLKDFRGEQTSVDLASSSLGWELGTIDYLLGAKLGPKTRRLIRQQVTERVLRPVRRTVRGERGGHWWLRGTNNWNAVCLAGVTGAALTLLEDAEERAFFVAAAEQYSRNFLDGFTPDGYCSEGVGYWNYGFGHYVLLAEMVWQATDGQLDLMEREGVRAPAAYGPRVEIVNGVYPAFADCSVGTRPSRRILYYVSRRLQLGLSRHEDAEVAGPRGALPAALMYAFPNSASQTAPSDEAAATVGRRSWFEDAGVLVCRPDTGTSGQFGVAMKGGHNAEHHNHNDVGSYVVAVGGQAVLLDPGSEVYTRRTFSGRRYESDLLNSWGHPVPVVAGELQRTGEEARGEVLQTEFSPQSDALKLDLSSAYEVPALRELTRTFVYSRRGQGSLTVRDEVAFAEPSEFGLALVTFGRWKRADDGTLTVYDTRRAVELQIDVDGADYELSEQVIEEDVRARSQPTRIGIDLDRPVTEATVVTRVRPLATRAERGEPLLANGGFEEGEWGWSIPDDGISALTDERAASGERSLRIADEQAERGSDVRSARIPVPEPGRYELRGKTFPESGEGLGLYIRFFDENGRRIPEIGEERGQTNVASLGGSERQWRDFTAAFDVPEGVAFVQLWVHSYNAARVTACLDDLRIVPKQARGGTG